MRPTATPYRVPLLALSVTCALTGLPACAAGGTPQGEESAASAESVAQVAKGIAAPQVTEDADTPTGKRTQ